MLEDLARNVAQAAVLELSVFHAGERLERVGCGFQLVHPLIEGAPDQLALHSAEEYDYLEGLHIRMTRNELVAVVAVVEIEEVIPLAVHYAGLVELAAAHSDVFVFRPESVKDDVFFGERYPVDPAERGQKGDRDSRGGRKAAYREHTADDSAKSEMQLVRAFERRGDSAHVVAPVALLLLRYVVDVEFNYTRHIDRTQIYGAVLGGSIVKLYPVVDRKAGYQTVLMVDMRPHRTYSVWREDLFGIAAAEGLFKQFFKHCFFLIVHRATPLCGIII